MKDCVFCKYCEHGEEYTTHSKDGSSTFFGGALFCNNPKLMDIYYNTEMGKRKAKKDEVDATTMPPVLIGRVVWTCKGLFFEDAGGSLFAEDTDIVEEDEEDVSDE